MSLQQPHDAQLGADPDLDAPDPYDLGLPADKVLFAAGRMEGKSMPSRLGELQTVRLVVQEGTCFRQPDLADDLERRLTRRLARRVLRRVERLAALRAWANADDPEIEREISDLIEVLERLHALLAIDVEGAVPKVTRALGPCWADTDPNDPSPHVRRARLVRPNWVGRGDGALFGLVAAQCSRTDGLEMTTDAAVERALDVLVGMTEPELRVQLRDVVVDMVGRIMDAGRPGDVG